MSHTNKIIKTIAYGISKLIPDKIFLKIRYRFALHKKLNLNNPQTYNEKLQWMKLYDRNPLYTQLVDKYEVKKYVAEIIGEEYIISTLMVWDKAEDIDVEKLPNQFVLKCTHDSGSVLICQNKKCFNVFDAKKHFKSRLRQNHYIVGREWPYKNIKPRVIAEPYYQDDTGTGLKDYKFFCFDGIVKAMFIATDRGVKGTEVKFDFFDENFNHLPFKHGHENARITPSKPQKFEQMKDIAQKLSKGFKHVRVDLYNINGRIYFGEITFFHHCGFVPFSPEEWDVTFGNWIKLD